jgi:hypothetical protein
MRRFAFAVLVLFATTAVAQEAVTIKLARPKAGDRVRVTRTEKTKTVTTVAAGGKEQKKDEVVAKSVVYVDEIITPGENDKKPVKLKRTYEKYEVSKSGKEESGPPLDKAILIEKTGEAYTYTIDGKPVEAAVAARLAADFERSTDKARPEDLLPEKPVKPGDTWKIEGAKLVASLGGDARDTIDADRTVINGKLVKTYRKDGKLFGVAEFDGDIAIASLGGKVPVKVKPGAKLGIKMTVDACIDGTTPGLRVDGKLTIALGAEGAGITLNVTADGTMSMTEELLPKK